MLFIINRARVYIWVFILTTLLQGCSLTSLMFYPFQNIPMTPDRIGVQFEEIRHEASDGTKLVSWWLPAKLSGSASGQSTALKGTVLYLHGNAQNISYHQFNINWLPSQGYNVLMLGYRQFGQSEGIAKLPNIFLDVHSGLNWILAQEEVGPLYILGQSMGASLSVFALASYEQSEKVVGVVLDAAFDSYPGMAAHAMSNNWFTWPLQLPAYIMTNDYDPEAWIRRWPKNTPLLMMHSPEDQVVPYEKGRGLYELANSPKYWVENSGLHIATFKDPKMKQSVLDFFSSHR